MKTTKTSFSAVLLTLALVFAAGCTKPNNENNDNNGGGSTPGGNDNGGGSGTGTETLFLPSIQTLSVTDITISSAICEGLVDDDGGSPVTERGICWSTSSFPTINGSHSANGNGTGTFSVTINGLSEGTTYHVRAYAVNAKGTAYGGDVSFTTTASSTYPNGVLPGAFSVSYSKKVRFSQGNLQYIGSGGYWRFADHQWEHFGNNGQGGSSTSASRDLFAWGTSGWDCGNTYYKPYEWGKNDPTLFGPPGKQSLVYTYANSDWGVYNAIVNGGNRPNQWRTPTEREWVYLFKSRSASTVNGVSNARYMLAVVNDVFGMVLFPDVYTHPSGVALPKKQKINVEKPTTNDFNSYNGSEWLLMEEAGCVFLPITGFMVASGYSPYGEKYGYYWTASCSLDYADCGLCFGFEDRRSTTQGGTFFFEHGSKNGTNAVRLVREN